MHVYLSNHLFTWNNNKNATNTNQCHSLLGALKDIFSHLFWSNNIASCVCLPIFQSRGIGRLRRHCRKWFVTRSGDGSSAHLNICVAFHRRAREWNILAWKAKVHYHYLRWPMLCALLYTHTHTSAFPPTLCSLCTILLDHFSCISHTYQVD